MIQADATLGVTKRGHGRLEVRPREPMLPLPWEMGSECGQDFNWNNQGGFVLSGAWRWDRGTLRFAFAKAGPEARWISTCRCRVHNNDGVNLCTHLTITTPPRTLSVEGIRKADPDAPLYDLTAFFSQRVHGALIDLRLSSRELHVSVDAAYAQDHIEAIRAYVVRGDSLPALWSPSDRPPQH